MNKDTNNQQAMKEQQPYQIIIQGEVDQARISWFQKLDFEVSSASANDICVTVLMGRIIDQAHLRGILNKLWDLNFEVIEVSRLTTR